MASSGSSYSARQWYEMAPADRINHYKTGVPAKVASDTAKLLKISLVELCKLTALSRSSIAKRTASKKTLTPHQAELIIGMLSLLGELDSLIETLDVAEPDVDLAAWLSRWMSEPLPALGGQCAAHYFDTVDGQQLIRKLLVSSISGAYV